jgi:hypothetical protein
MGAKQAKYKIIKDGANMKERHNSGLTFPQYEKRKKVLKQLIDNKTVVERKREQDRIAVKYITGQVFYCSGQIVNDIAICI